MKLRRCLTGITPTTSPSLRRNILEPEVTALETIGQFREIEAEQVQNRRVQLWITAKQECQRWMVSVMVQQVAAPASRADGRRSSVP